MSKVMDFIKNKYGDKTWVLFLDQLLFRYDDDGVPEIGAQLTYFLILAIFPFLIFFLSILKFTPLADAGVLEKMLAVLPVETQKILYDLISEILTNSNMTLLSLGALGAIWSSSKGIMSIIKAINRAFDLEEDRPFFKLRGLSILFTLGLFLILILSFTIMVFGEQVFNMIFTSYSWSTLMIFRISKFFIPIIVMTFMFSILYKFSPSIKDGVNIPFWDTLPGSIFASLGLVAFTLIFSFYINNFGNYTKTYGSLGGIIILLIWLYSSSIVVVLGAEISATFISMKNNNLRKLTKKSLS